MNNKKIKLWITSVICITVMAVSCSDDFLNTKPLDKISSDAVWSDGPLSEAFVFSVYSYLGNAGFEEQALAALTDEAMFTHSGRNINTFTEGSETPSNIGWISDTYSWNVMFLAIRQTNTAITELPESTFEDKVLRDRLMGEAHFLRAYYYHQLLRYYGAVPIIDFNYGLGEDYNIARNTFEENINFITSDLDMAASLLNGKEETDGRATELAAKALKSRVLMYAASDLHDGPTASANSSVLSGYSNLEYVAYTSGSQDSRWDAAKSAALAALNDAAGLGYKMDLTAPESAEAGTANYVSVAMGGKSSIGDASAASELIFKRTEASPYAPEDDWPLGGLHNGINNGPNGYHNWAGNTPIQLLVDDYEMMDGSKFDWGNEAHAANPYTNRDPRFYGTVLYDGAGWKPRPGDVTALDPMDQIQTGAYDDGDGGTIPGLDTRQSAIEDWNGSRTGYYVRKFIDPDPAIVDNQSNSQLIPWPFIRYTELALNYAEACLETGDEATAVIWLNKIRFRAGMPAISASGDALRDIYRNERRVELAYEEHRYHDARRWMIAPETLGRGIKVMSTSATLKGGQSAHVPYRYDPTVYDYTYTVIDNTEIETRSWVDQMYYRPISRDEISRNELLVQNPGF